MIKSNNPILVGKLYKDNENIFMRKNFDDIQSISQLEFNVLNKMDGTLSLDEISDECNIDISVVKKISKKYSKNVFSLYKWNKICWCEDCHTYVIGNKCGICERKVRKLVFSPPCDPTLCFDEERKMINKKAKEFGIDMPDKAFYLINCGVKEGDFFWEVAYSGEIIFRINFSGKDFNTWEFSVLHPKEEIQLLQRMLNTSEEMNKMIISNQKYQNEKISDAKAIINYAYTFFETKPLLYYSTGKESSVIYSLLKEMNKEANILTVTTGIDFPEDVEFMKKRIKEISKEKNFTCHFFESDENEAIDYLNKIGKLSILDPWCRLLIKKKQKNIATQKIYDGKNFIAFEGTRQYETNFRRSNTCINILKEYPNQVWVSPIIDWTSLEVWLYLYSHNEPINPIYTLGFQRTTCWLCPAVPPFSILLSQKRYPELWEKIRGCKLEAFENNNDKDIIY